MNLRRSATGMVAVLFALGFFFFQPGAARCEVPPADIQVKEVARKTPAEKPDPAKEGEQAAVSLEQAVKTAKEAFTVPGELNQFTTGFDQSDKKSFWDLRWSSDSQPGDVMNVRVNAATGDIWGIYRWTTPAPGQEYRGLPKYSREQARGIAAALAEKLQPERFKETRLQPDRGRDYLPPLFEKRGQVDYRFNYARIVDGVPCPENGIEVAVSGDTGEVVSFNLRWDDTRDFPPAAGRINQARAGQIFRDEAGPELNYFRSPIPGGKEAPLKLVYRLPVPQEQVLIDALTGKLLSKDGAMHKYDMTGGGGGDETDMAYSKREAAKLTLMEEVAVEEAKNLLPREKALELAASAVKAPQGYTLNSSRLEQDYFFKEKKTWHFNWQAGEGAERKWMNAVVDASTGELVAFSMERYYGKFDQPGEVKFSEEAARKIAEEYIKQAQPGKWEQVVFKSSRPDMSQPVGPAEKPQPRSYSFGWARVFNDIQFPDNGFFVNVDSATGNVISYRMTWWDVDFPGAENVIGRDAAADKFLREAPLTAAYLRLWSSDHWRGPEEAKVYLVYHMPRSFAMLDALTGQTLNHEGNVVRPPGEENKFSDLEGHPAREAVEQLARAGIIAGDGGKFRPDDAVTQAELIVMLAKSGDRSLGMEPRPVAAAGKGPWYQRYYDAVVRMGVIQAGERPDPDAPVTRETLARLTINAMGYSKVARLSDIYVLDFQDAAEISGHLRGHAALAAGLGLLGPAEGKFLPKEVVTRGRAAVTLVKMLNSK